MEINEINSIQSLEMMLKNEQKNEIATDFKSWVENKIQDTNQLIQESDVSVRELALGDTENLHQIMMSLEKAKTEFSLMVQVRNKLLEGYQEVMRMQI